MKPELRQLLLGCAFAEDIEATSAEDLIDTSAKAIPDRIVGRSDVSSQMDRLLTYLKGSQASRTMGLPLATLTARDMVTVCRRATKISGTRRTPIQSELADDLKAYCAALRDFGLPVSPPKLFFVKRFPKPYQHQAHWALTVDAQDAAQYRMASGVYFRDSLLMPFASSALLAHELTHVLLSDRPSSRLVRGLEEGVADVLAFMLLSKCYDDRTAMSLARNFRLYHPLEPIGWAYLHALKSACYLLSRFGLHRFVGFVQTAQREGRQIIEVCEQQLLLEGRVDERAFPEASVGISESDSAKADEFAAFIANFTQGYVVSPLARYVADFCEDEADVATIASRSGLSHRNVRKGLGELEASLYLVILDGDKLIANECGLYIKAHSLRYDPSGKR